MSVLYKTDTRRWVPLHLRDILGLNAHDQLGLKECFSLMEMVMKVIKDLGNEKLLTDSKKRKIGALFGAVMIQLESIIAVEVPDNFTFRRKLKNGSRSMKFEDFGHLFNGQEQGPLSSMFRFQNIEQLERLKRGFEFPDGRIKIHSYRFEADEIIMISLFRLAHPSDWLSVGVHFPHRSISELGRAFYWFLDFLILNWGYLLLNNMEFWLPYLPSSAEAIRGIFIIIFK